MKGNLVAVISNGTAILGPGDRGAADTLEPEFVAGAHDLLGNRVRDAAPRQLCWQSGSQ